MDNFNTKIGIGRKDIIGPYGLDTRNERGDILSKFSRKQRLRKTFFRSLWEGCIYISRLKSHMKTIPEIKLIHTNKYKIQK